MHIFNVLLYVTVQHELLNAKLNPYIYHLHNSNMVSNRLIQINDCCFFFVFFVGFFLGGGGG